MEWLKHLFSSGDFLPHGTCYHFGVYWLVINQPPPGSAFAGLEHTEK